MVGLYLAPSHRTPKVTRDRLSSEVCFLVLGPYAPQPEPACTNYMFSPPLQVSPVIIVALELPSIVVVVGKLSVACWHFPCLLLQSYQTARGDGSVAAP